MMLCGNLCYYRVMLVVWHKLSIQGLCKNHISPESRVCARPPGPPCSLCSRFVHFLSSHCTWVGFIYLDPFCPVCEDGGISTQHKVTDFSLLRQHFSVKSCHSALQVAAVCVFGMSAFFYDATCMYENPVSQFAFFSCSDIVSRNWQSFSEGTTSRIKL